MVSIAAGTTVTYDADSTAVLGAITIQSGGTLQFATNVNTEVIAADYLVLPGGTLDVGTQANPIARMSPPRSRRPTRRSIRPSIPSSTAIA